MINAPRGNRPPEDRDVPTDELALTFSEAAATCPVESAIDVIAGRWKLLVLRSLFLDGEQRFNHLLRAVTGISAKELTRNLRELESSGLVEHGAVESVGTVSYSLSELGRSLLPVFREIGSFGERLNDDRESRRSQQ